MTPRWIVILTTSALAAAACATSATDHGAETSVPPIAEAPVFPTDDEACTCSPDGRRIVCEAGAGGTCGDGQRCAAGRCVEDACEKAKAKQSAEGCSFYTVVPDAYRGAQGCYAIFLTNTSPRPVDVKLRIEGVELTGSEFVYIPKGTGSAMTYEELPNGQIPENGLAIAFVAGPNSVANPSEYRPCPAPPAVKHTKSEPRELGFVPAISLETSEPVVASDIYPYGGADSHVTGATILLPVNAWGTSYVTAVPGGATFIDLIAAEGDTVVSMTPKSAGLAGGDIVLPTAVGRTSTLTLRRGEAYHLVQPSDLTGVILSADTPFLASTGSRCWGDPCDAAHQQLPSTATLGWEYAAVGHRDRLPNAPVYPSACTERTEECLCRPVARERRSFRLVGVVDGTVLSYEPSPPPGAPTTIEAGRDAWIDTLAPFVVKSQDKEHPFLFTELMTSCTTVDPCNKFGCPGDPEFTIAVPTAQFLKDYLFFTDPTYPTTHLVVVRQRDASGSFAPVRLDCMGEIDSWSALGRDYEYARFDLVTDGVGQRGCDNGRHRMSSEGPFSTTIWGWGFGETHATSYAFPASRGLRPVNPVGVK